MIDLLISNITTLYTMQNPEDLGRQEDVSLGYKNGLLCYMGDSRNAPSAKKQLSGKGLIGVPGLVDPHTHAVWAGSRADEFARRLAGENYTKILEQGGGILSTVTSTRAASESELTTLCRARLSAMLRRGTTTAEVKSGYGLSVDAEHKMLQALQAPMPVRISPTFLGAHTIPKEYKSNRDAYVEQIINEQLPLCAPLAESVDVYCDKGAFDLDESIAILKAGKDLGLRVRAHSEQVEYTGIAAAAARIGATCVDHLEQLKEEDVAILAACETVAVFLPGAQLYLKDPPPPINALREAGVTIAVGTDLNPGSSPLHNLWTAATLSCLLQGLTMKEALLGITKNAGIAIGHHHLGWIGKGACNDLVLVRPPPGEPPLYTSLLQHIEGSSVHAVIKDGQLAT
ncbi:MAG: imidazolonepropionase [Proteobacteria bacterium]|nr:imidazolonepropionase [Pseudomonadota bacterium]